MEVSYGQVCVEIPEGLESAIHVTHHFVSRHGDDDDVESKCIMNVITLLFLFIHLRISRYVLVLECM